MAITLNRECNIEAYMWGNGTDWTTSTEWNTPFRDYSDSVYEPIAKGIRIYKINGTGDAKKTQINLTLHAHKYNQSLGQNPSVRLYVLSNYPLQPKNVPSYALATKDVAIDENTSVYNVTIDGFNITNFGIIYVAITYTGDNLLSILFNKKVNVTVEADETPPTCSMWKPASGDNKPNYSNIEIAFSVDSPSGTHYTEAELQCSYDNNDWTNPIVSYAKNAYTVPANTFHGGTIYCRCRAKTAYSEWGAWAYESFTAVERTPFIQNYKLNGGYDIYQDRTSPIVLTWQQVNPGITVTHSDIKYALPSDYDTWIDIGTVQGDSTTYTIPANTFPAIAGTSTSPPYGGIKLRVFAFNINGIASNDGNYRAFVTVDSAIEVRDTSPKWGASADETKPITFSITTANSLSHMPPSDADMRWKTGDGEWQYLNHLADSLTPGTGGGNPLSNSVVIPANTFPAAVIYYQVRAYNQDGVASDWSSEAYFTTVDKPQIATPLQPINTIEDADKPILFVWGTSSQSGEASRGAELQYSTDQTTWVTFARKGEAFEMSVGESATFGADETEPEEIAVVDLTTITVVEDDQNKDQYTTPSKTFPPGVIFWHVRSYNRNLTPGDWSAAVSFVAKAAPTVQDIQATAKPWATVIWQADDQQTYEIFVDGESLGSYFGTAKQFPLPDYLEDGVHTVGVRVMGSFSLWSQINETQITIANTQAAALTLTAETAVDTALTWEGGDGDFFIYRDGLMIAHTNAHSFTDRVVLGTHEYRVIERLASGDYNASETLTQTPAVPYQHIAALAGGDWIAIPYTLKSQAEPSYQESQETAFNYLSGNDYPIASIGSHRTDIGQYSAVFLYTEEAENLAFLALRGKPVILKTADGEVMIGVLNAWERRPKSTREKKLYTAYTFSLQRIGWEDFIDDTA